MKNSDAEVVKAVLPCWPRLYNTLATDSEHKVREATHISHNEVVQKVKRNLAPHLKSLIAAWFTSQYDTYPPAASAAVMSFRVGQQLDFFFNILLTQIFHRMLSQRKKSKK